MYVVTGATGNTGKVVAQELLAKGQKVRVIGRSAARLQSLVDKGAEPFVAEVNDAAALTKAFHGAKAVYVLIPPDMSVDDFRAYQNVVGAAQATAIRQAEVPYVVQLSSIGGHLAQGTGPIIGLHDQEQRLKALPQVNVLHLRPAYFMENLFMQIPIVKQAGVFGSPIVADAPMPMIATQDIGAYAAKRLLALDFAGKSSIELLGQRDLTMKEVTAVLAAAIGKHGTPYVQFPYDQAEHAMIGMGLKPSVASLYTEMLRGFNEGTIRSTTPRTAANTTPTTIEAFAPIFAAAFAG